MSVVLGTRRASVVVLGARRASVVVLNARRAVGTGAVVRRRS